MNRKKLNPAAGCTADGAQDASLDGAPLHGTTDFEARKNDLYVHIRPRFPTINVGGQEAQTGQSPEPAEVDGAKPKSSPPHRSKLVAV